MCATNRLQARAAARSSVGAAAAGIARIAPRWLERRPRNGVQGSSPKTTDAFVQVERRIVSDPLRIRWRLRFRGRRDGDAQGLGRRAGTKHAHERAAAESDRRSLGAGEAGLEHGHGTKRVAGGRASRTSATIGRAPTWQLNAITAAARLARAALERQAWPSVEVSRRSTALAGQALRGAREDVRLRARRPLFASSHVNADVAGPRPAAEREQIRLVRSRSSGRSKSVPSAPGGASTARGSPLPSRRQPLEEGRPEMPATR